MQQALARKIVVLAREFKFYQLSPKHNNTVAGVEIDEASLSVCQFSHNVVGLGKLLLGLTKLSFSAYLAVHSHL